VWIPAAHPAAAGAAVGLAELAQLDIVHGPRRASPATYDAWLGRLRASKPRFAFTDPPFRNSLPMTLAFAATGTRPTAVLTGPRHRIGPGPGPSAAPSDHPAGDTYDMVPRLICRHPLAATAGLVWHAGLPRELQQVLFDTADAISP